MRAEFLSPHSIDACIYHLRAWLDLNYQVNGSADFSHLQILPIDADSSEFSIRTQPPFLPPVLTRRYFGFGIIGTIQRQDSKTTYIRVSTRVGVHPILALHTVFFYFSARQLLVQFRDVLINPKIGGSRGYEPVHGQSKSKQ